MPTYVCWSKRNTITAENRQRIATALTDIHHEVVLVPREIAEIPALRPDDVWVYLDGVPGHAMTEYGEPLPDPGVDQPATFPAGLSPAERNPPGMEHCSGPGSRINQKRPSMKLGM